VFKATIQYHKTLKHNNFHGNQWPSRIPPEANLPEKLTQIYHKYLKTRQTERFFFMFFY